jgi:hypothetical protein
MKVTPVERSRIMQAAVGDRIIIKGHRVGEPDRDGRILEVRGADGGPPYLVQWEEDGHEGLFFPGIDAEIHHYANDDRSDDAAPGTDQT